MLFWILECDPWIPSVCLGAPPRSNRHQFILVPLAISAAFRCTHFIYHRSASKDVSDLWLIGNSCHCWNSRLILVSQLVEVFRMRTFLTNFDNVVCGHLVKIWSWSSRAWLLLPLVTSSFDSFPFITVICQLRDSTLRWDPYTICNGQQKNPPEPKPSRRLS